MTDRIKGLTVVLERDTRIDDVQPLVEAIAQLRGVLSVACVVATPQGLAWGEGMTKTITISRVEWDKKWEEFCLGVKMEDDPRGMQDYCLATVELFHRKLFGQRDEEEKG